MKRHVGINTLLTTTHSHLPCLIGNLNRNYRWFKHGQRVYLVNPHEYESGVCEVRYRNRDGVIDAEQLPYEVLRDVRLESVASHISVRCWRDTPELMAALAAKIVEKFCPRLDDFSVNTDV